MITVNHLNDLNDSVNNILGHSFIGQYSNDAFLMAGKIAIKTNMKTYPSFYRGGYVSTYYQSEFDPQEAWIKIVMIFKAGVTLGEANNIARTIEFKLDDSVLPRSLQSEANVAIDEVLV